MLPNLISLHFRYGIQKNKVSFWCKKEKQTKNNMELWTHSAMYLWFVFSWHTLGHTICASLSIVVDHAHITSDHLISFLEHELKRSLRSANLNPIEHLWNVVEQEIHIMHVQLTNLGHLCNAVMLIWTKTCEECTQRLLECMSQRIN